MRRRGEINCNGKAKYMLIVEQRRAHDPAEPEWLLYQTPRSAKATDGCMKTRAIGPTMRRLRSSERPGPNLSAGPISSRQSRPACGTDDMCEPMSQFEDFAVNSEVRLGSKRAHHRLTRTSLCRCDPSFLAMKPRCMGHPCGACCFPCMTASASVKVKRHSISC